MFSEKLLEPVSEASPAGEEDAHHTLAYQQLEALVAYLAARLELTELERMARAEFHGENAESDQRVAESNVADGRRKLEIAEGAAKDIIGRSPSKDGVRDQVRERAEAMLTGVSKDLRIVQHLALAATLEEGIGGLESSFRLIDALLERYDTQLHPRPDEDDPNDVSDREMVVSQILDDGAFVAAVRECVLLEVQGVGRYTPRDTEVIDGKLDDDRSGGARSVQQITGIAQAAAANTMGDANEVLRVVGSQVEECLAAADKVIGRFAHGAITGDRVLKLLHRTRNLLKAAMEADVTEEGATESQQIAPIQVQGGVQRAHAGLATAMGALRSREDARKIILQVCKFLEETEPSHPAPFFLRRAERLLGAKDFFEIMTDMAPNAIDDLMRITGHQPENQ
jgi:type VI secretion system protein ImpA